MGWVSDRQAAGEHTLVPGRELAVSSTTAVTSVCDTRTSTLRPANAGSID